MAALLIVLLAAAVLRFAEPGIVRYEYDEMQVAVLAKEHALPFYVAAPASTFDDEIETGDDIIIEERAPEEVTRGFGRATAPDGTRVYSPAFDITPHDLISQYITDSGNKPGGRDQS